MITVADLATEGYFKTAFSLIDISTGGVFAPAVEPVPPPPPPPVLPPKGGDGGAPGGRKKRRRGGEYIPSPFDRPDPATVRLVEEALKQALPLPASRVPLAPPLSSPPLPGDAAAVVTALSDPTVMAALLKDRPLVYIAPIDRVAQAKRRANLEAAITLLLLS